MADSCPSSSSSSSATHDPQKGMVGSSKVDPQKGNDDDGVDPQKGNPITQLHSGESGEEAALEESKNTASTDERPLPVVTLMEESVDGELAAALFQLLSDNLLSEHAALLKKNKILTKERLGFMSSEDIAQLLLPLGDRLTLAHLATQLSQKHSALATPLSRQSTMSALSSTGGYSSTTEDSVRDKVFAPPQTSKTKKSQAGQSIADCYFQIGGDYYIEFPTPLHYHCAICDPVVLNNVGRPMRCHSDVRKHGESVTHKANFQLMKRGRSSDFFKARRSRARDLKRSLATSMAVEASGVQKKPKLHEPDTTKLVKCEVDVKEPKTEVPMDLMRLRLAVLEAEELANEGDEGAVTSRAVNSLKILRLKLAIREEEFEAENKARGEEDQ